MSVSPDDSVDIQLEAFDANGDPLTYEITEEPEQGELDTLTPADDMVDYTAFDTFTGTDSFKFKADDGIESAEGKIVIVEETADSQQAGEAAAEDEVVEGEPDPPAEFIPGNDTTE